MNSSCHLSKAKSLEGFQMKISESISILAVIVLGGVFATAQTDRITIYVSGPIRDGFVDTSKDVQDSIKDISNRLKKKKELQLVDSREEADINLTVVTRGVGYETFGQRLHYTEYYDEKRGYDGKDYKRTILVEKTPIVTKTLWVASVLEVGQYRKEFVGSTGDWTNTWGTCAARIADDVKAWAVTNREQLMQRRKISQP